MKIPVLDLKPQIAAHRAEIMEAINSVVDATNFILGPEVAELEKAVASYTGAKHAIGVASGSDALLIALMALGVGNNDAVITTPYTFFATVGAISRLGALPIFVDIRPNSFNIDVELAAERLKKGCEPDPATGLPRDKTSGRLVRAIIPVHLYGQCADMGAVMALARQHNISVVEDAAQALGAQCNGIRAGSIGHIGCLSFYPTKNLGGFGDGGMITTSDDALAEQCRIIRVHGSKPKYYHALVGINSRLDAIQAAVLRVGLKYLDQWASMRREHARTYTESLRDTRGIVVPLALPGQHHVFNQYVIRSGRRDALKKFLTDEGIGTEIYYPLPLHVQQCFSGLGHKKGDFPESERAASESLAIPIFPYLTTEQRKTVTDAIKRFQES
ncbi:MAG: DegT/DnrJ/EryC1/StrS family aminotransferase [Candidatus Lindowbacteria bacterium]|nr:DegT/DnrJ/EryC1/StrS family aminotransferase [Candidatus Lindowbacteria bacterium]